MRTPRQRAGWVAALAALSLTLAACAGSSDSTSSSGSSADAAAEGGSLKLWHYESANGAMGIAWDKAIEIFKTEHPGVEVNFERKAFEQIQQNAGMIISSDEGPDIMEYNKGNATAGLLASQGLLTDLTEQATARGWDTTLPPSLQTTARYDEKGVMGEGNWYGVPNYGEYVMVYYNKDAFAAQGISVPTTLDEFTAAMDTFVAAGTTPLCMSGAEYPAGQLAYQLALTKADRSFVDDYQLYKNPVDFQADPLKYGADTFDAWVKAGYISQESASLKAEDMGTGFIGGKCPMIVSGILVVRPVRRGDHRVRLGHLPFPGHQAEPRVPRATSGSFPRPRRTRTWPTTSSTSPCAPRSRNCSATAAASRSRPIRRRSPTRRTRN